ncbi:DUF1304 family protein [Aquisphaera insulae]|uniref:DUF1304 family protein n=1 Tax=Aquisphaera insulae TaxID=2712864 RepID=UPI0013EA419B|nr:DUF1304 family protein [Aquisphaera insulae]
MGPMVLKWLPVAGLVPLLIAHAVFAYKEIFDWENSATKILGMSDADARAAAGVGRNQGYSNAALAAGAAWGMAAPWLQGPEWVRPLATFFGTWAVLASVVGYATFEKTGFLVKQGLPGLIAVIAAWLPAIADR